MLNKHGVDITELINNNLTWAENLGRMYANNKLPKVIDPEWVAGIAVAGLYDAATKWNPDLINFKSYASRRIKGHIRDELRKVPLFFNKNKKDHPTAIHLSQLTDTDTQEDSVFDIEDIKSNNNLNTLELEELTRLIEKKARAELEGVTKAWVIYCVLGDLTQKELANNLGLSEGRIAQVKKDPALIAFFNEIKKEYFPDHTP